ncbi:MAG: cell division protein SepF [Fimbriimonadaceae bacterium]|nr:cell division protein SepF [Fimbriimonadaceae bacterium]
MEEQELQDRPGFFKRVTGMFAGRDAVEDDETTEIQPPQRTILKPSYQYHVTIRKGIQSFDEALQAGAGIKRGEQQILNLADTEPGLRRQIKDFLAGVNFAQEGTWQEIGQDVYILAPASAFVEVVPSTPASLARNN